MSADTFVTIGVALLLAWFVPRRTAWIIASCLVLLGLVLLDIAYFV